MRDLVWHGFIMLAMFSVASSNAVGILQDQLYRNTQHGFRIKFPAGWKVTKGDGPNIVQKATSNGASILVQVNVLPQEYRNTTLKITEVFTGKDYVDGLRPKFPDAKLVSSRKTKLGNEDALYVECTTSYQADDIKIKGTSMVYIMLKNGRIYYVLAGAPTPEFERLKATFRRSMLTFVFEQL